MEIKRRRLRLAVLTALIAVTLLPACGSTESTGDTTASYPGSRSDHASAYTIWGTVTVRGTGEPYDGATVEFRNLSGYNVHMDTNADGEYSLQAPADVYTAFALDLENENVDFDIVGQPNNVVEVPPDRRVDFEAYPVDEYGEPIP